MKRLLLSLAVVLAAVAGFSSTAQTRYTLDQIRNSMLSAGYTSEQVQEMLPGIANEDPARVELFMLSIRDANDPAARSARYHAPNFDAVSRLMLQEYQSALQMCKKTKPEAYKKDKKYGIFSTNLILPVMKVLNQSGINGFSYDNLKELKHNPLEFEPLREALVMKYDKKKPEKNIVAVSAALNQLYGNFVALVKAKYDIQDYDPSNIMATIPNSSGRKEHKITLRDGKVYKIENLYVPFELEAPRTVDDKFDVSYSTHPSWWLDEIDDEVLWNAVFEDPDWETRTEADGTLKVVTPSGASVTGFDLTGILAETLQDNEEALLFTDWYMPYVGLPSLSSYTRHDGPLKLRTNRGIYDVDENMHVVRADEVAAQLLKQRKQEARDEQRRLEREETQYASHGYIEVLDILVNNTDVDLNVLNANGEKFYDIDMRYLQPVLKVKPHAYTEHNCKLYIKIVKPDGSTDTSDASPYGYTFSDSYTVDKNTDTIYLQGWGNNEQSTYVAGTYTIVVYSENGDMLASKNVKISPKPRSGEIEECWTEHNVWEDGWKSIKVHAKINTVALKGKTVKLTLKFHRGKVTYSYTSDLYVDYDYCTWNDQWIRIAYANLKTKFGDRVGSEIAYDMILTGPDGKVLDAKRNMTMVWIKD